jgi:predicted DNA-binding transcriptional regulator YafY
VKAFHCYNETRRSTRAKDLVRRWTMSMCSRIEPMKKIARMLRTHRELPPNYFNHDDEGNLGEAGETVRGWWNEKPRRRRKKSRK